MNKNKNKNKYIITGQNELSGEVSISGAKNSVLPILASSILNAGITILNNVPLIIDTFVAIDILRSIGASVDIDFDSNSLYINTKGVYKTSINKDLASKMRCSIVFLGSLLARFKEASIYFPGGCNLGDRPIDIHLNAFKELNINIDICDGDSSIGSCDKKILADARSFKANHIMLPFASVGATQNLILASIINNSSAEKVIIKNTAKEPEITDLILFLRQMGAIIYGENTDTITITPIKDLDLNTFVEYDIMPDRIEAGTFLCIACSNTNKNNIIKLNNIIPKHLAYITSTLISMGAELNINQSSICVKAPKVIKSVEVLETSVYPLFPTDLQQQFTALLSIASGKSIIKENIFNGRHKHIDELNKMGAQIKRDGTTFYINGISKGLVGSKNLVAYDLRGGACLIQAGLIASGTSIISNANYVMRGYEKIEQKLQAIGADIKYI